MLTKRQIEVLRLVSEGKSSKQVADVLGISFTTVKLHRAAIHRTFKVQSVVESIICGIRLGIIPCICKEKGEV